MAKQKNYIYTSLDTGAVTELEISGTTFHVVQYNDSWAVNEIPLAQVVVAVGRDLRSPGAAKKAAVHLNNSYRQMTEAKVYQTMGGEYDTKGTKWPNARTLIFDGYFLGFTPRKVRGKYQVVANVVHWLIDLTCSSCLTGTGHFTNPTQLNVAACLPAGAGTQNQSAYTSISMWSKLVEQSAVSSDLWGAIKAIFCKMANTPTLALAPSGVCEGSGKARVNTRALKALKRMEGGGGECAFTGGGNNGGNYAVPLAIKANSALVLKSLSDGIANECLGHYANVTFWDKLVGQFCPQFGMAVVPMVDRALVVADLPGYRGNVWKDIGPDEYDALDMSPMLEQPLRGVGVTSEYMTQNQAGVGRDKSLLVGGCYIEKSVDEADGIVRIVPPPAWLSNTYASLDGGGSPDGTRENDPGRFNGCDGSPNKKVQLYEASDVKLYTDYAHMIYVSSMLRGRAGQMAGRLRFDIAPNSLVRLPQSGEALMAGEDQLAMTQIACVARVNTVISADGPRAGTQLQLTHLRREDPENKEDRTSIAEHPLFGGSIHGGGKHGAPLVPAYDL